MSFQQYPLILTQQPWIDPPSRIQTMGREGYTGGRFDPQGGRGKRGGARSGRGDDSMVYCYYCKEPSHTYQCPLLKGKPTIGAYMASQDDEELRHQFEQFQLFRQQKNTRSVFIFLCHSSSDRYPFLLSYIVYVTYLDYRFRSN